MRCLTKDGVSFNSEVAIKKVAGLPERPVTFMLIIHDITERKRAENELKCLNAELESRVAERTQELTSNRAFLAAILDSTVDAILTVDEHGIIQSINKATIDLFGYDGNELLGRNLSDVLCESYRPEFKKDISRFLQEKKGEST